MRGGGEGGGVSGLRDGDVLLVLLITWTCYASMENNIQYSQPPLPLPHWPVSFKKVTPCCH